MDGKSKRESLKQRNMLLSMRLPNNKTSGAANVVVKTDTVTAGGRAATGYFSHNNGNSRGIGDTGANNGKLWRMSYSPQKYGSKIPSPKKESSARRTFSINNKANTKIPSPVRPSRNNLNTNVIGQFPMKDLTLNDFDIGKKLGKGKFGKVYCVKHKLSGFICALKVMDKNEIIQYNVQKQFRREVEIQSFLNHKNLTQLYGYFYDDKRVYLLMEYLYNGELYKLLREKGPFNDIIASYYVYQMADALKYMHDRKIIHRDLKPENILIGFNNTVKLTDFGWSIINPTGNKRKTLCGTIDYLSPELINSKEYDNQVDVWALGVLTYELVSGSPPFEEDTKELTYKRIVKGDLKFPPNVSKDAQDLITKLLRHDPSQRIPLSQVICHPWIEKNKPFW